MAFTLPIPDLALRFRIDPYHLKMLETALSDRPQKVAVYVRNAINHTAAKLRTKLNKDVAGATGIGTGNVGRRIFVKKAAANQPYAQVKVGRAKWPLIKFKPKYRKRRGRGRRGIGVAALVLGQVVHYPHAFIAAGPKQGRQVWQRAIQPWRPTRGDASARMEQRIKLKRIAGASPADAMRKLPNLQAGAQQFINEDIGPQMVSQIRRALNGK